MIYALVRKPLAAKKVIDCDRLHGLLAPPSPAEGITRCVKPTLLITSRYVSDRVLPRRVGCCEIVHCRRVRKVKVLEQVPQKLPIRWSQLKSVHNTSIPLV
eukprot:4120755-Prymnesium_polylepis.2